MNKKELYSIFPIDEKFLTLEIMQHIQNLILYGQDNGRHYMLTGSYQDYIVKRMRNYFL